MGSRWLEIPGAVVVSVSLRDVIGAAADLYLATGKPLAVQAAGLMRLAEPRKPPNPPQALSVLRHLQPVLPALLTMPHDLAQLPWTDGGFSLPAPIRGRNAYAELVGPEGPFHSTGCRFGLYLQ